MVVAVKQCAKCGVATEGGQFYRFHYGIFADDPARGPAPDGRPADPGPTFRELGSEVVFHCDRCLIRAAARGAKFRAGLFLGLALFGAAVVAAFVTMPNPGLWSGLLAVLVAAALGVAAYRRYRCLHAALCGSDAARLRQVVSSTPKIQNMGDEWAIASRRQALQDSGANLFLTRSDYELWSPSGTADVTISGRASAAELMKD